MTEAERDAAEAGRASAEVGRVEAEEDRVDAEVGEGGHALEESRVEAEASRVRAEIEREERENRRRIAEGGPDNHFTPGTPGRIEAEAKREQNLRKWLARYATLIALGVALIALIPTAVFGVFLYRTVEKLDNEIASRCEDAAVNRDAIRQTLLRSFANLGYMYDEKTGSAVLFNKPLAYYLTHPDERQEQLDALLASVKRFPSVDCGT